MAKLNEIVAVVKDRKAEGIKQLSEANKIAQRVNAFMGFVKDYQPLVEDGEKLPREAKQIEWTVPNLVGQVQDSITRMLDTTRLQDEGNTEARASIVIEGGPTIADVPATHLLYLEKVAQDFITFINNLPVLDAGVAWTRDNNANGLWRSEVIEKFRTKKVQKPLVMYPATDKHPAQTQLITEDVNAGKWKETNLSGAISYDQKRDLLRRARAFQDAVRIAREQANATIIKEQYREGKAIFDFVFALTPSSD